MANREAYNTCMKPYITGSKPKEQRKLDFCIGAKMCSGRSKSTEEAKQICLSAPPKEPRRSKKGCTIDLARVAECLAPRIQNLASIDTIVLAKLLQECSGQKAEQTLTRERFIKKCFKENGFTGDIKEAEKLRSMCTTQFKEQYEKG